MYQIDHQIHHYQRFNSMVIVLKSLVESIPDLVVNAQNQPLIIGRAKHTQIKDLKCPRKYLLLELPSNSELFVTNLRTNQRSVMKEGDIVSGPGFSYKVCSSSQTQIVDSSTHDRPPPREIIWETQDDDSVAVLLYKGGGSPCDKIASFDFDGTLIKTKSGKAFAKSPSDWQLFHPTLTEKIRDIKGQRFVIFSNQKGVSTGALTMADMKERFKAVVRKLDVPCIAFMALRENINRKPRPGMFYIFEKFYNNDIAIRKDQSFYVGDAAGRKTALCRDHGCADVLFALNVELPFLTPEEYVAGKIPLPHEKLVLKYKDVPVFRPLEDNSKPCAFEVLSHESDKPFSTYSMMLDSLLNASPSSKHMVIFVGLSGCGKSTFYTYQMKDRGYHRISRDELGTMEKCEKEIRKLFRSDDGGKIVVDNTNVDPESRSRFIKMCLENNYDPIAIYFNVPANHCIHNNVFRKLLKQQGASSTPFVADWLIKKQANSLVLPSFEEKFKRILKVNFAPQFAPASPFKDLYFMYLSER